MRTIRLDQDADIGQPVLKAATVHRLREAEDIVAAARAQAAHCIAQAEEEAQRIRVGAYASGYDEGLRVSLEALAAQAGDLMRIQAGLERTALEALRDAASALLASVPMLDAVMDNLQTVPDGPSPRRPRAFVPAGVASPELTQRLAARGWDQCPSPDGRFVVEIGRDAWIFDLPQAAADQARDTLASLRASGRIESETVRIRQNVLAALAAAAHRSIEENSQ